MAIRALRNVLSKACVSVRRVR